MEEFNRLVYADVHNQILLEEMINIKELSGDILKERIKNISIDNLALELEKIGLNIENIYFSKGRTYSSLLYVGEYVSTPIEVIDGKDLNNKFFGINNIVHRENAFKELFLNKDYSLYFFPENNTTSLHHFLKLYKKIPKEQVYEVFKDMYSSISYGFNKIPTEVIEYVFLNKTTNQKKIKTDIIKYLKEHYNYSGEDTISIYRGQGVMSSDFNDLKFSSWTLSKEVASKFTFNDGIILKGEILLDDIIEFIDDSEEEEVWCKPLNIKNIKKIVF